MVRFAVVAFVLVLIGSNAYAGTITGVTQELSGTVVPNVRITVTDLSSNQPVGNNPPSDDKGNFTIQLPPGSAVSVVFERRGNLPASLVGISGDVNLQNFAIFMPVPDKPKAKPKKPAPCTTYRVPSCPSRGYYHLRRCR